MFDAKINVKTQQSCQLEAEANKTEGFLIKSNSVDYNQIWWPNIPFDSF